MVNIIVAGCIHGELDRMYRDVLETARETNTEIDLILCCGDFQAIRNYADLTVLSVPLKYRKIGDFWRYYNGEKHAPILTVFIGGNHEASNYLQELPYGGWVAPNIFYLGYAGIVNFKGLRIGGLSGIYKRHDYFTGHYEHAPYDDQSKRTAYHVRNIDAFRLLQIKTPVDIVMSHDWPRGIYHYGDRKSLCRIKPHFTDDISNDQMGSPPAEKVLVALQPRYWFSAHMHVKFTAHVRFPNSGQTTKFLALDKCMPRKSYLQLLSINPIRHDIEVVDESSDCLQLDPEWLCILKSTNHFMSISKTTSILPNEMRNSIIKCDYGASEADIKEVKEMFNNKFRMPNNFELTAPAHSTDGANDAVRDVCPKIYTNPQTDLICAMLELLNPNGEFLGVKCGLEEINNKLNGHEDSLSDSSEDEDVKKNNEDNNDNPEEIDINSEDSEDEVEDKKISYNPVIQTEEESANVNSVINKSSIIENNVNDDIVPYDPLTSFSANDGGYYPSNPANNENTEKIDLDDSSKVEDKKISYNPVIQTEEKAAIVESKINKSSIIENNVNDDVVQYDPLTSFSADDGGYHPENPANNENTEKIDLDDSSEDEVEDKKISYNPVIQTEEKSAIVESEINKSSITENNLNDVVSYDPLTSFSANDGGYYPENPDKNKNTEKIDLDGNSEDKKISYNPVIQTKEKSAIVESKINKSSITENKVNDVVPYDPLTSFSADDGGYYPENPAL